MSKQAEKIQKLLNKAASTDNPAEAQTFSEAAERLMVEWGVDDAMLDSVSQKGAREKVTVKHFSIARVYAKATCTLYHAVAHGMGMDSYRTVDHRNLWIVGHPSDLERFSMLITSLDLQCSSALRAWWKEAGDDLDMLRLNQHQRWLNRCGFISSFGYAVCARLTEMRETATEATTGSELVLRDRADEVRAFMDEAATKTSKAKNFPGNSAGLRAGRTANLGSTNLPGGRPELG